MGEDLVWLIGAVVCLLAAPLVQWSVSRAVDGQWPHNVVRYDWLMPISCHFRDCKALLVTSLTPVSSATCITSVLQSRPLGLYAYSLGTVTADVDVDVEEVRTRTIVPTPVLDIHIQSLFAKAVKL